MAEQPQGRYRFQAGRPLDPDAGVHPEMMEDSVAPMVEAGIPNSPQELIAMQNKEDKKPQKPERQPNPKVQQVLDLLDRLDTTAAEDQQVALAIVRHLEEFHDNVVKEMQDDADAKHTQIVNWAVDADRLYRCRMLLESVDLI
jgi:hypothetical protein